MIHWQCQFPVLKHSPANWLLGKRTDHFRTQSMWTDQQIACLAHVVLLVVTLDVGPQEAASDVF